MKKLQKWTAALLAVLIVIQSFTAIDFGIFQEQVVYANTEALAKQSLLSQQQRAAGEIQKGEASTALEASSGTNLNGESSQTAKPSAATELAGETIITDETATTNSGTLTDVKNGARTVNLEGAIGTDELGLQQLNTSEVDLSSFDNQVTTFSETSTTPAAISVPANVSVTATETALTVSWEAVSDAESYDISLDGNISITSDLNYTYGNLAPNTSHIVKIRAVNQNVSSEWSVEVTVYTLLATPANLTATSTSDSVALSWDAVAGATYYEIYRDDNVIGTSATYTYTDSGLAAGTTCVYRIKAYSNSGNSSSLSNPLTISTLAVITPAAISIPENVVLTSTDTTLTVSWDAVEGANGYDISFDDNIIKTTVPNYTFTALEPNTEHTIKVRTVDPDMYGLIGDLNGDSVVDALDMALIMKYMYDNTFDFPVENDMWIADVNGDNSIDAMDYAQIRQYFLGNITDFPKSLSAWSDEETKYTLLPTPVNIVTTPSISSVVLTWDSVTSATGYEVYRDGNLLESASSNSYSDNGLIPGETYEYSIKAYNAYNVSAMSNSSAVTTIAPPVPSNVTAETTDTTLAVSWDSVEEAESYDISLDNNITNVTTCTYAYNGLEPNTQQTVKVRTVNSDGVASNWSTDIVKFTKLATPFNFAATTASAITIDLAWDEVNGADSYDIKVDNEIIPNVTGNTYQITSLASGLQYFISVRAKNSNTESAWSEEISQYTLLSTPSSINVTTTANTMTVSWNVVPYAANYDVELDGQIVQTVTQNSCVINDLAMGTTFKIRIKAKNELLSSEWSNEVSNTTQSYTNVSGTIYQDTTWTLDNSPYMMTGSVTIAQGATLTIEPGVVVKGGNYSYVIDVKGKLIADGDADNPIAFTTHKDSEYGGSGISTSFYDYWGGINVSATGEFVGDNVKIRYGAANGRNNSSTLNVLGKLTLNNSEISNSQHTGVYISTSSDVSIKGSKIENSSNGIYVYNNSLGNITLENNIIVKNQYNGIYFYNYGTGALRIQNNEIINNGYAVYVNIGGLNSPSTLLNIKNNVYENNTYNGISYDGIVLSGTLSTDLTLTIGKYYLQSSICVPSEKILTIEPGTIIKGTNYSSTIQVQGKLIADGDLDNPIVFTTQKDSNYGGSGGITSYTDYWGGINVSMTGEFEGDNVKIRYGAGYGLNNSSTLSVLGKLTLTNSEISNSQQKGIYINTLNDVIIEGNTISKNFDGIEIFRLGTANLSIKNNKIINIQESTNSCYRPILINIGGVNSFVFEKIQNNTYLGYMRCNGIMIKGTLSEDFTLNSGTYYIHSDLIVPSGKTLIVNQGVIFKRIDGYSNIIVNGIFQANGATGNPVVFTTYGDTAYGGNIESPVYCGGIIISETGEFIGNNIKIRYGAANDYNSSAISASGKLTLTNSELISTNGQGIGIYTNTTKDIAVENTIISGLNCGIYVGNTSEVSNGTLTIINNIISDSQFGIVLSLKSSGNVKVEDNNLIQNSWGIYVGDFGIGKLSIQKNNIEYISTGSIAHSIYVNLGISESIFTSIKNNTYIGSILRNIEIGGTLKNNLILSSDTYCFSEDIIIPKGLTLKIASGSILMNANHGYGIKIDGTLDASSGTKDNPIAFSTIYDSVYGGNGSNQHWYGIYVSPTGTFNGNNVKIKYGGYYDYFSTRNKSALKVEGKLILTNSEILSSHQYGIYFNTSILPVLLFNTFYRNSDYGLYNYNTSTPIDARYNYWGSAFGPSTFEKYITENGGTSWRWVGEGDRVGTGIDYTPWLGSEMNYKLHFGQSGTNPATGNFSRTYTDLTMDAPGFDISFSRTYNSRNDKISAFGRGWTFSYEGSVKNAESTYVDIDGTTKTVAVPSTKMVNLPDGSVQTFKENTDGTYTANNTRNTLVKNSDGTYTLISKEQNVFYFNANGYLVKMEDRNGNAIIITVDSEGKVTAVKDQVDRQFVIAYQDGLIKTITDITDITGNRIITYNYENQRLTEVIDARGNSNRYIYDADGFLTEIKDNNNKTIEAVTYVNSGDNKDKVDTRTDVNGNILTYSYDNINCKTTITDSSGRATTEKYDSSYSIINSVDAEEKLTVYEYNKDSSGVNKYSEQKSVTDRNGNKTIYDRDAKGNITKITNPDQSTRVMTYDAKNNVTSIKDEMGKYTFFVYDANQKKLLKKVQPLNGTDQYIDGTSDASRFAITTYTYYTDAEGQENGYKAKALLKSVTDAENKVTAYTYDTYGNIKTVTDAENKTITTEYNSISQLLKSISAEGYETEYVYDKNGNVEKQTQTDSVTGGSITRITYDSENRRTKEVSPNQYASALDNLANHEYNGNHGNRYTYYDSGKINTITDANNYTTTYTYDIYGNLKTETKPNNSIYTYEYDVMNRPEKVYFQDSSTAEKILLEENTYAILANKNTQTTNKKYLNDTEVAITISVYDYAGRLISQTNPDGTTISTAYNVNGTINNTTDAKGSKTYYKYDGLNRLTEQWIPFENVSGTVKYTYQKIVYDKAGKKLQETIGKATVAKDGVPTGYIAKNYEYYANGWVKTVTQRDEAGTIFGKTEYEYDADGNINKKSVYTDANNNKNITEYIYNYMGKVVAAKVHVKAGDMEGNEFTSTEDKILSTLYTYDKNGNLQTITTPDGVTTTYTYDNMNRQTSVSQPGIDEYVLPVTITSSTEYDWQGNTVKTTDAKGNETIYTYNNKGLLEKTATETTDATGVVTANTTAFYYDRVGRLTAEVAAKDYDPAKTLDQMNRVEYTYDLMGRVKAKIYKGEEKRVDPTTFECTTQQVAIVQKAYKYDANGNVIKELDALGFEAATDKTSIDTQINTGYGTEYTYNLANKLETVLDAETKARSLSFTTKYSYDALGRTITETAANGAVTKYNYDGAGNIISLAVKKTASASEQIIKTSTYDSTGKLLEDTSYQSATASSTITYEYNALGQVRTATYPEDDTIPKNIVTYQYDVMGRLKSQQDTKGAVDTYTYNNQGDVLSHTQKKQDNTEAITTSTRYDKNGNARFVFDGNGKQITYTYNEQNKVITSRKSASGIAHETTYTYDANGNQIAVTDWRGNTTINVYDSLNRLIETKDAYGKSVQKLEYNHSNIQEKSYDALNKATVYTYDKNNRLLSTTDPESHTTSQTYDNVGNIASKTDGRGNTTTYTYDEFNRLKTVVNAKNETTAYTYDLSGNLLTQTDGKGNTTTYEYNVANKATRRIDQGGRTGLVGNYTYITEKIETYTYNADGSFASKTDRNRKTTLYVYDIHGRLQSQTIQNTTGSEITFTYDGNGNQLTMTDSTGTTTRTYDELGRVLTKTVPNIGTTTFQYDIISGMDEGCYKEITTDPKGNVTIKVFDKAGRLKTVTADEKTTTYSYYDNGARQSVTYNDGTKAIAIEEYTYYENGLLWTLINKKLDAAGNSTVIDSYTYTYDAANNQTSKIDSKGITSYTYDELNRLETVTEPSGTITTYTFDGAGNRKTQTITKGTETTVNTYTYNEQNRLTQVEAKVNGTLVTTTVYAYDDNGNQLTTTVNGAITVANVYDYWNQLVQTMTGTATTINAYNGEGYRVAKTVNGTLTRYLYDGDKVVLELDSAGNETARNVYGSNLLMRTALRTDGSNISDTYFYLYNGHADVTALLKPDGTIAATYYYDAFGNITDTTGSANNSITFAGYQYDAETGLYYLNARMYDPKTARFLQEDTYLGDKNDPLSLNLYTYCANNPIIYHDPTGHFFKEIWGGIKSGASWLGEKISDGASYVADKASDAWDATTEWTNDNVIKPAVNIAKDISNAYSSYKSMSSDDKKVIRAVSNKALGVINPGAAALDGLMSSWEEKNQKLDAYQKFNNSIGFYNGDPIKTNVGMGIYQSLSNTVTGTYNLVTNPFEMYDTFKFFTTMLNPSMTQDKLMYQTSIGANVYNKINEFNDANAFSKIYMGSEAATDIAQVVAPFGPKIIKSVRGLKTEKVVSLSEGTGSLNRAYYPERQLLNGGEWNNYFKETYGAKNVTWEGTEALYRTMSKSDYEVLTKTGNLRYTRETFTSTSQAYAARYDGVPVEFKLKQGNMNALEKIGVRETNNSYLRELYPDMPEIKNVNNWRANNAYFKYEDGVFNIGLGGKGKALDIFNNNIIHFEVK